MRWHTFDFPVALATQPVTVTVTALGRTRSLSDWSKLSYFPGIGIQARIHRCDSSRDSATGMDVTGFRSKECSITLAGTLFYAPWQVKKKME